MGVTALPIVLLEIEGKERLYYADKRLGEYRSIDGSQPWIVSPGELDCDDMDVIVENCRVSSFYVQIWLEEKGGK